MTQKPNLITVDIEKHENVLIYLTNRPCQEVLDILLEPLVTTYTAQFDPKMQELLRIFKPQKSEGWSP